MTFKPGDRVRYNGNFKGSVIRMYSKGMVEIRGERGSVCIGVEDARKIT